MSLLEQLLAISKNTFKESIRQPVLFVVAMAATLFIIFIPVFFIMVESVRERFSRRAREEMTEDREGVEGEDSDKDSPDQQPIPNKVVETSSNDESNGHSKGEPTNE